MRREEGRISINTENIFPIIKKWLYSEKDIFIRELVSNASDAISKLKKLVALGEAESDENANYFIKVEVNRDEKTIKIIDNGIGMTEEEVKKYINQIAFSGAKDFIEKYKDKSDDAQIIGHFGLGFYSSFMVSERVRIDTLSFKENEKSVSWVSEGGETFEIDISDKKDRGTEVTLYLAEDSLEFLDELKVEEILKKYFSFLPFEIYLEYISTKKDEEKNKEIDKEDKEDKVPTLINDTNPLWLKNPKDCTDEEYKEFYKKVFNDFNDPLFWIHLNMDYPFNLKGILYFPKLRHEFETVEGQIKLYYNQVFVANNIKEVIPEFLMLLKGTVDCPDLPLNVSRSFLQNDGYVNKISSHIIKKVADKLVSLFETNREDYNKYWDDISPFLKYGCIREEKFYSKVKDVILYKTTGGDYATQSEYLTKNDSKHKNKVFYVTDEKQQAQYISIFRENDMEAIILPTMIDSHFVQFLETKNFDVKFYRIDSDISDSMKDDGNSGVNKDNIEGLKNLFKEMLGNDKLNLQVEGLKTKNVSGIILLSEQSRRMQEMSRMFGGGLDMSHMFDDQQTLLLNTNNSLIQKILELKDKEDKKENIKVICEHIYDLALMNHKQLEPQAMVRFVERSNQILEKIATV